MRCWIPLISTKMTPFGCVLKDSNCKFIFGMIWEVSITSLGSEMEES